MTNLQLLASRRFAPFFWTQFFGAFNDNFFKNALVVLVTFHTTTWTTMAPSTVALLASAIFMLPFFLFSAIAGQLADKYHRNLLAKNVKILEIGIMLFSGFGFFHHQLPILLFALFLFGVHSALFGPVKYAILPQHLNDEELLAGNALIEGGTFIAILGGTVLGALMASLPSPEMIIASYGLLFAVMGYIISRFIPNAPGPNPGLMINMNPVTATQATLQLARAQTTVFPSILAISWFWAIGLLYLSQFPVITKDLLHGNEITVSLLLGLFSVGIGIGSVACEKVSHHHVNMRIVHGAGYALGAFTVLFGVLLSVQSGIVALAATTLALGVIGGFFCVPLYTAMQQRSQESTRAQTIASNNIMNSFFMVGAAGIQALMLPYVGLAGLFLVFGIITLLLMIHFRSLA